MKKLLAVMMAASVLIMAFPQTIYAEYVDKGCLLYTSRCV